jgi:hypothetical protein
MALSIVVLNLPAKGAKATYGTQAAHLQMVSAQWTTGSIIAFCITSEPAESIHSTRLD